ncbi:MAG: hypothetical protein ACHQ4H_04455 [Ktedonobacterales bacterium]
MTDIVAHSPLDVWAAGSDKYTHLVVLRYGSAGWSALTTLPSDASWPASIALLSRDDGWVASDPMLHFDGVRWTRIAAPSSGEIGLIQGIDMLGDDDGWATSDYAILHYSDNRWISQRMKGDEQLRGWP